MPSSEKDLLVPLPVLVLLLLLLLLSLLLLAMTDIPAPVHVAATRIGALCGLFGTSLG
jgi:hypothetical protein